MNFDAFFQLHRDLPREGPGSDEATREAIWRMGERWQPVEGTGPAHVLDVGCGPGRHTLVLARELEVPVTAIDSHEPFLDQLRERAAREGLDHLITTRCGRMESLGYPPDCIDLIWAEGSIYNVGFSEALRLWRPLLREGGLVVASDATWLTDNPPDEAQAFWDKEYPEMTTIEGNIERAATAGFEVFDHFVLPRKAWWDEYLTPLTERAERLLKTTRDPDLLAAIEEQQRETDICRRFGEHFGYVFYLMRKVEELN